MKAGLLAPLISADPLGRFMEDWVGWARLVTVRRLRDDVEWALTLEDTNRAEFRRTGGLPADREIGAKQRDAEESLVTEEGREIGAQKRPAEACMVGRIGPVDRVRARGVSRITLTASPDSVSPDRV